jgi:hypothetical protein
MALKYQKGTVYPRGKTVKMWYGRYTVYFRDEKGKEVGKRRNVPICPKAGTTKWKAEEMLHALILKDTPLCVGDSPPSPVLHNLPTPDRPHPYAPGNT